MIATDHAPHSAEEKSRGLEKSLMGVVGLETAFPVLYTGLVRPGLLPLEKLVDRMSAAPRARFGLPGGTDYSIWDLDASSPSTRRGFRAWGGQRPLPEDGFRPLQGDRGRRKAGMAGAINRKLVLADGTEYLGAGFGAACDRVCELVFQTSMVGYQEIVSDPSYTDQMVVMTYPLIGNYWDDG